MTLVWVDPFSGVSGDMLLGALVDAGAALDDVRAVLEGLALPGWALERKQVQRAGIRATHVRVGVLSAQPSRPWAQVRAVLAAADLPAPVRERSLATFTRLARAEARVHAADPDDVHFHEVGALDALVDVVGVCAALHLLGAEHVTCAPVAQGRGRVSTSHGQLPVPAPAVLELLCGAPTYQLAVDAELCTPTGAALLAEWTDEWGPMPPLRVTRTGYGAGTRDLGHPNVVRVVLGEALADAVGEGSCGSATSMLETTLDDLSGELVPVVLDALRDAGAADAWARPVLMKKGRPGVEIVCLAASERLETLRRVLFTHATTLGVRSYPVERNALVREWRTVQVAGKPVRLKIGMLDGRVVNVAPEFDDCRAAAEATGLPLKEVFARARAAWRPGEDE